MSRESSGYARAESGASAAERIEALRASMLGCTRCAALARCRSRVVPGTGNARARVMFIGIAPGRFGGDRTGIPFSGDRSGEMLRRMVAHANLGRVFITNVVRCNPRDARGRNRDPGAAEIANCRPHLEAEIALVRPRVIVCLGRIAWRELTGRNVRFEPERPVPVIRAGMLIYPMYHPGYVIRGVIPERSYARQFQRLSRTVARSARRRGLRPD